MISGTMMKLNYGQFTGVIQVMKVVSNQMVLTFCENLPGKQFFTIVLSRQPNIFSAEVEHLIRLFLIFIKDLANKDFLKTLTSQFLTIFSHI